MRANTSLPLTDHFFSLCLFCREAVGSYAENQRITAVRRVYQRGIINPMINIERLWQEYCNYEQVGTQGNLKGESVVAGILPSHMEESYCTSGFFHS